MILAVIMCSAATSRHSARAADDRPPPQARPETARTAQHEKGRKTMAQTIRTAVEQDLDAIAAVEAECFPAAEAATRAEFAERLRYYGNHFWLLGEDETLAAFVDGMVTDAADLTDAREEHLICVMVWTVHLI